MKHLIGNATIDSLPFFAAAAQVATAALCRQARCGTVIVQNEKIIGQGYNGPPLDQLSNQRCGWKPDITRKPNYDVTCCVHAEWRAILDATRNHPTALEGSILYFMRINDSGDFTDAGAPYCTTCSRIAMEAGIAEFRLWDATDSSVKAYPTDEYDRVSAEYYL